MKHKLIGDTFKPNWNFIFHTFQSPVSDRNTKWALDAIPEATAAAVGACIPWS